MKIVLSKISHTQEGFKKLIALYEQTKNCLFEDIDIDMGSVSWFDAHICAAFGAILSLLSESGNSLNLINLSPAVETILSKNGFLSYYGREKIPDQYKTTIPYRRFHVKDEGLFANYIQVELLHRNEIPDMSKKLLERFCTSILEIFSNAVIHSQTKSGIFCCGQFFPKSHQLIFSIVDLGIGMRQNILEKCKLALSAEAAIRWATEERNTTKQGQIPGGLGLKLIKTFIDLNDGRIHIVSDAGYWLREKNKTFTTTLATPFPGTIVTIEINTADKKSYKLSSESSKTNIF